LAERISCEPVEALAFVAAYHTPRLRVRHPVPTVGSVCLACYSVPPT